MQMLVQTLSVKLKKTYRRMIREIRQPLQIMSAIMSGAKNPYSISSNFVRACCEDNLGNIWIGTFKIKVWDYSDPISSADEGNVVKIRGTVSEFRGTPQITVDRIRLADDNDTYDLSALVPVAPIDVDTTTPL